MIVKFKSIKNWKNHVYYLFNENKHQNQEIIGNSFFNNFNKNQQIIDSYHLGKNGRSAKYCATIFYYILFVCLERFHLLLSFSLLGFWSYNTKYESFNK